jgi:N-acetylneuraminic acid mutarotase
VYDHTALYRHKAVPVSEERVIVFGGKACSEGSMNSLISMIKADAWTATLLTGGNLKDLPCLDSHSLNCIGEYLYIFGGFESSPNYAHSNKIYRVDIDKQLFELLLVDGYLPEPRMNFASCLDTSSRLIVLGGSGKTKKFSDLFRFDFVAKRWKKLSSQIINKVGIV